MLGQWCVFHLVKLGRRLTHTSGVTFGGCVLRRCCRLGTCSALDLPLRHVWSQAVVPRMAHRDPPIARACCGALAKLLAADAAGDGSRARDAVQLVADLVKRCKCALTIPLRFLGLQLLNSGTTRCSWPPTWSSAASLRPSLDSLYTRNY